MKKFVQMPARTKTVQVATFEFVSSDMIAKEDTAFRELVHDVTEGKMSICWKDGIICADCCPSGEYVLAPGINDHCLDLYRVITYPMTWKVDDCTNNLSKELKGNFGN